MRRFLNHLKTASLFSALIFSLSISAHAQSSLSCTQITQTALLDVPGGTFYPGAVAVPPAPGGQSHYVFSLESSQPGGYLEGHALAGEFSGDLDISINAAIPLPQPAGNPVPALAVNTRLLSGANGTQLLVDGQPVSNCVSQQNPYTGYATGNFSIQGFDSFVLDVSRVSFLGPESFLIRAVVTKRAANTEVISCEQVLTIQTPFNGKQVDYTLLLAPSSSGLTLSNFAIAPRGLNHPLNGISAALLGADLVSRYINPHHQNPDMAEYSAAARARMYVTTFANSYYCYEIQGINNIISFIEGYALGSIPLQTSGSAVLTYPNAVTIAQQLQAELRFLYLPQGISGI